MTIRCGKCRATIGKNSAFSVLLTRVDDGIEGDVVLTASLREGDVAVHVNGDPLCERKASGYRGSILEKLHVSEDLDLSFLDTL